MVKDRAGLLGCLFWPLQIVQLNSEGRIWDTEIQQYLWRCYGSTKKYACGVRQHCISSWPKTQGLCWHYWGTLLKHLSHGHLPLTAEICLWTPAVVLKKHWEMCVGNSCVVCSCSCHILQGDVVLLCFLSLCLRPCIVEVMQRGRSGAGLKMSDGLVSLDLTRTDQCYFDLKIERRFKPQMREVLERIWCPCTHLYIHRTYAIWIYGFWSVLFC